ncbi:MAG TPA: hypothetical protein VFV00_11960 [Acidimicrobiales bacterium]|nr:hypothetical protein [Acidimicrobiales bacterium]
MTGLEHAQAELEAGLACLPVDIDGAVAHLSAAVRAFDAAGDRRGGALACSRLGNVFADFMGNRTAARAWFARADRLVADEPPCLEQGWVAVAPLGCDVDDPDSLLARAELALDRARQFGTVGLEIKALADGGLAHVQAGRLEQGMAMLDEAMALICAEQPETGHGQWVTGQSVCSFYTACYFTADFDRAAAWTVPLREHGVVGSAPGSAAFLSAHCDTVRATLLCELGRWGEAEAVLEQAISMFESTMHSPSWHPAIQLADLRVRQGRLAEAEALLLGKDASIQALLPAARLHFERGEHALALATARRGMRTMGDDKLRSVELLTVMADAALASGDTAAALSAIADLDARSGSVEVPPIRARASAARARVLAATGDLASAIKEMERAVDALVDSAAPWLNAVLLLELARLHEASGDRANALVDAKAAAALLTDLDVVLSAVDQATLAHLLGSPAPAARAEATLRLDGKWWEATCGSVSVRVADTKGMRYVAALVACAECERHAFDLVDAVEGVGEVDRRVLGDAGELADSRARAHYRQRVEALRSQIDEALEAGADQRAMELQDELDAILTQLAQDFGLGGAPRTASSAAQKARLNVTRAVRAATAKLAEALPDAGAALDRSIRTGLFCAYAPEPGDIRWIVQS